MRFKINLKMKGAGGEIDVPLKNGDTDLVVEANDAVTCTGGMLSRIREICPEGNALVKVIGLSVSETDEEANYKIDFPVSVQP